MRDKLGVVDGGEREYLCTNLAQVFYCVKGREGKSPTQGREDIRYWVLAISYGGNPHAGEGTTVTGRSEPANSRTVV